jgi:hypothetical protein
MPSFLWQCHLPKLVSKIKRLLARHGHYWPWISVYFKAIAANNQGIDGQYVAAAKFEACELNSITRH